MAVLTFWSFFSAGCCFVLCIAAFTTLLQTFAMGSCMSEGIAFVALSNVELGVVPFSTVEAAIYDNAFFDTVVGFVGVMSEYNDGVVFRRFLRALVEW
jgi:Na+/H+ antiporter NhaB